MREVITHLIAKRRVRARMKYPLRIRVRRSELLKIELAALRSGDFTHGLPKPARVSESAPVMRDVPRSPLKRKHRLRQRHATALRVCR